MLDYTKSKQIIPILTNLNKIEDMFEQVEKNSDKFRQVRISLNKSGLTHARLESSFDENIVTNLANIGTAWVYTMKLGL